jgi:TfoX/Sxy family transcriptional regulator of competence genes
VTAASDALAARLRPLLDRKLALVEKPMFGGIGFMHRGNMLIGTTAKGMLLVRVDPDRLDEALARPGAEPMHMGPRVMTGFLAVRDEALPDNAAIKGWIDYCLAYVKSLPAK